MQKDKATFGHRVGVIVICWSEWGAGGLYVLRNRGLPQSPSGAVSAQAVCRNSHLTLRVSKQSRVQLTAHHKGDWGLRL